MKKILTLLISSAILYTACQKGGVANVEGHVYKAGTNIPLQHARINLIETHNANQGEWSHLMYTDENGYYSLDYFIRFNKSYQYYIMITPDGTYDHQTKQMKNRKEKFDFYFP